MIKELENLFNKLIIREAGAIGYRVRVEEIPPKRKNVFAKIDMRENTIEICIPSDFRKKKYIENICDIVRHEIGHWEYPRDSKRGCPYDFLYAEVIFNETYKNLSQDKKDNAGYVANCFMDIIDNLNVASSLRDKGKKFSGMVWFYENEGVIAKEYTPFYSFFVRIQEELWMSEEDKKRLQKFHNTKYSKKVEECVDKFFSELNLIKSTNDPLNVYKLLKKDRWGQQAGVFAKIATELLDIALPAESLPEGTEIGKEDMFDKMLKDPSFMGKIVRKRWDRSEDFPSYIDEDEALSLLYRELAKDIPIKVDTFAENFEFPLVGYGKKEAELSRKIWIRDDELIFVKSKYYWSMPIPLKKCMRGVPNLFFIIDCSGSMIEGGGRPVGKEDTKWGSESKYHYTLLGFYGIINYLERMNIRPSMIGLVSFSTTSRSSVVNYGQLKEIERILFSPQFGNTIIDLDQVKDVCRKLEKSVIIMISDGDIHNWDVVSEEMKEIMSKNYSAFISIKDKCKPFYDLRSYCKVLYVDKEEDLPRILLDFSRDAYGGSV